MSKSDLSMSFDKTDDVISNPRKENPPSATFSEENLSDNFLPGNTQPTVANPQKEAEPITEENIAKHGKFKQQENFKPQEGCNDLPFTKIIKRRPKRKPYHWYYNNDLTANKFTNRVLFEIGPYLGKPTGRGTPSLFGKRYALDHNHGCSI